MKKTVLLSSVLLALIFISSCSKKGCTDKNAPNFNSSATKDDGTCTDLTANIAGMYSGAVQDSVPGITSNTTSQTINITKIDDSHVQVSATSGGSYYGFTATVSTAPNGYFLAVGSQTSNGTTLNGYTLDGNASHNGAYLTSGRVLSTGTTFTYNGNTILEFFVGVHQ